MKQFTSLATCLLLCFAMTTFAQKRIKLSSSTTTNTYEFSNYTTLEVSGDFKVNLDVNSNAEAISIEANSNLMDRVEITQEGTTLRLKLKDYWNFGGKMILNANIQTKGMVSQFQLSGDAIVNVNAPVSSDNIAIMLKGDSILKAELNANKVTLLAKSDAIAELWGTVANLDAQLASDSILKAKDLQIANTSIDLSGDSQATIHSTSTLSAIASGDSILRYKGNPDVKKSIMTGDSEIHRMR